MVRSLPRKQETTSAASNVSAGDSAALQAIAAVNGGLVPTIKEGVIFPVSTAIQNNPEIGRWVPRQGIYLGKYKPVDRYGISLGKVFNVFAAPEDLPVAMTYVDTVKYIAKLKKWHGFNGTNYPTAEKIYAALKRGSYKGGWIIPPRELLCGSGLDSMSGVRQGKVIQPDNLFDHQNKGTFKGSFKTVVSSGSDFSDWYWTSTVVGSSPPVAWYVSFSGGRESWHLKDYIQGNCRPVRLVEVLGV